MKTSLLLLLHPPSVLSVSASALCSSVTEFCVALLLTCDSAGSCNKHNVKTPLPQNPPPLQLPSTFAVADAKISGNVMGTARLWSSVDTSKAVSRH